LKERGKQEQNKTPVLLLNMNTKFAMISLSSPVKKKKVLHISVCVLGQHLIFTLSLCQTQTFRMCLKAFVKKRLKLAKFLHFSVSLGTTLIVLILTHLLCDDFNTVNVSGRWSVNKQNHQRRKSQFLSHHQGDQGVL